MPFYSMEFTGAVPNEAIDGGISEENILTAVLDIEDDDDEEYWD